MSTVENVFSFFRSPHLETHTIEITLDYSPHTKKTAKKNEKKNRVYQRYSSFLRQKNAESQSAKSTLKKHTSLFHEKTLIEHCLLKRVCFI